MKKRNQRNRPTETKPVMRHLAESARSEAMVTDTILEQLRQCPEAFRVGEVLGKAFDSLKYRQEGVTDGDRMSPPPGTIIPPFA